MNNRSNEYTEKEKKIRFDKSRFLSSYPVEELLCCVFLWSAYMRIETNSRRFLSQANAMKLCIKIRKIKIYKKETINHSIEEKMSV